MTQYFVDAHNGKDNNDGQSPEEAWASISAVNGATLAAGDTVFFRAGQWHIGELVINNNGSSGNPITIDSYGASGTVRHAFFSNPDYDDGNQPVCIEVLGTYIDIKNIVFANTRYAGIQIFQTNDNGNVENCQFVNCGWGVRCKASNWTFERCSFRSALMSVDNDNSSDNGGGGISIEALAADSADDIIIRNNWFQGCRAKSRYFTNDGGAIEFFRASSGTQIYDNLFEDCKGVMEFGGTSSSQVISDIDFYNNEIRNCFGRLLFVNDPAGSFAVDMDNVQLYHNTFYFARDNITLMFFDGTTWSGMASKFLIDNNIFYSKNTVLELTTTDSSDITHRNNVYYREGGGSLGLTLNTTSGEEEYQSDPDFVDAPYNLRINPDGTSDALGNAGSVTGYTADRNDSPLQSPPDIGAYQTLSAVCYDGILVTDTIYPRDNVSTYPVVDSAFVKGGFQSVDSLTDLYQIAPERRSRGMIGFTRDSQQHFWLADDLETWQLLTLDKPGKTAQVLSLLHTESKGTDAGNGTADAVNTRPFNVIKVQTIPGCTVDLSNDRFKLPPGLYKVDMMATVSKTDESRLFLEDVTNGTELASALNAWATTSHDTNFHQVCSDYFWVDDDVDIEIKQYYEKDHSTAAQTYGRALNKTGLDTEYYMTCTIEKLL